jgi:hypothetical protein
MIQKYYHDMLAFLFSGCDRTAYFATFQTPDNQLFQPFQWLIETHGIYAHNYSITPTLFQMKEPKGLFKIAGFIISEEESNFLKLSKPANLIETCSIKDYFMRVEESL